VRRAEVLLLLKNIFGGASELVTNEENRELTAPFLEKEVQDDVFDSYAEGAPV
jgi:hypothetical protein